MIRLRLLLLLIFISSSLTYAQAQVRSIKGKVLDKDERTPLIGVTVLLKGTKGNATLSDAEGNFKLNIPATEKSPVLIFSYIGYENFERLVEEVDTDLLITLTLASKNIGEVVVVGYGTQKKVNLTGAVSAISADRIKDRPVTSISTAMQGTMPGVTVTQSSGQPGGDGGTIRIRGVGTLNNNNPLVMVDGVASSMSNVNPDDVASISVLKDAASAAIYGSRAANGVILITTKKGRNGAPQITYNTYIGKQKPTDLPKYLPSWQAATLLNEGLANESKPARYTEAEIQKFKNGSDPDNYPNVDWLGLFYNGNAIQQNHYLNVSGGNDNSQYVASLGYFSQNGIIEGANNKRYTARVNLTSKLGEWGVFHANIGYTVGDFKEPTNPYTGGFGQYFREIARMATMLQYKYSNGVYGVTPTGNPMAWLESDQSTKVNSQNFVGNIGVDIKIVKGLTFKPTVGYNMSNSQSKSFIKDIQYYNWITGAKTIYQGPNSLSDKADKTSIVTLQSLLDYETNIKEHHIHAIAGYSQEYTGYSYLSGYRKNFLNNDLSQLNAGSIIGQTTEGRAYDIALRSYFGRVGYDYKGKYLLEGNIRMDGSSRFSSDNRWGTFPSVSAGWRISEEGFFGGLKKHISELKIRTSWGKLGNQVLSSSSYYSAYYPTIPTLQAGQDYSFNNSVAGGVANLAGSNSAIKWETTESLGVGFDAALFNNKVFFSADYFVRNTSDILMTLPISAPFGLTSPQQNAGRVDNNGFEFLLGYKDRKGDFSYGAALNASFIKNKVTDLKGTGPYITPPTFLQEGYPVTSFYGYEVIGIFKTADEVSKHAVQTAGRTGPGDLIYKDQNGDKKINAEDRVYLGSPFPKVTYGANFDLGWKRFDMVLFLQGAAGVKGNVASGVMGGLGDAVSKPTDLYWERWTPANNAASTPRALVTWSQNDGLTNPSSAWIKDASYLRLKNLQIGYNLLLEKVTRNVIKKARVYYSGQNILTFTKFSRGFDPEAPVGRGDFYPQVLTHTMGLSVTF